MDEVRVLDPVGVDKREAIDDSFLGYGPRLVR
jgi:hypothetical protein